MTKMTPLESACHTLELQKKVLEKKKEQVKQQQILVDNQEAKIKKIKEE